MVKTITTNDISLEEISRIKDIPTLEEDITTASTTATAVEDKTDWVDPRALPWGAVADAYLPDGTVNPTPTDNTEAIRGAIAYAEQNGKPLVLAGVFAVYGEIIVRESSIGIIKGIGSGSGYSVYALQKYKHISGLLFKGDATGQKRVRTRVNYRGSALDPEDAPLSVGLNIQAENIHLEDFTIFCDFERNNNSPTHFGANWDVGLFLGCRVHNTWKNIHVLGYWREAAIWVDVTRSGYVNEYSDLNGVAFNRGTVDNGCDGLTMEGIFTQGGKWGLKVQGAKAKAGAVNVDSNRYYGTNLYYDQLQGVAVTDRRGNFGCSDLTAIACSFYGANHHSRYRTQDTTGNYLTDTAGGSLSIDGIAGNASGMIQGMYFASCRFSTWEAYRIKLDRVNRVVLEKCHSEGGSGALTTTGAAVLYNDTDYYGPISMTSYSDDVVMIAFNATLRTAFIGATNYTILSSAGSDNNYFPKGAKFMGDLDVIGGVNVTGSIIDTSGEMDLRSATGSPIRLRNGSTSMALVSDLGLEFQSGITSPRVTAYVGELDLRGATGSGVRARSGSSSVALMDLTNATFYASTAIRSNADNTVAFGDPTHRASTVYAGTGTINTSDERTKQQIGSIPDEVLDAWSEVNYCRFKFNDAVAEKGEEARFHVGLIAQEIEEVFARHNLNAFDYGILCYDEWEDQYEDVEVEVEIGIDSETGEVRTDWVKTGEQRLVTPAGNRYAIRADECQFLEMALMRREIERLKNPLG